MAKKKKARAGSGDGGKPRALPETHSLGASSGMKKKKRKSDSAAAAVGASNWSALATKIGAGTNPKAKKRRAERLAAEEAAREGRGGGRFVRDGGDEKGPHRGSPHGSRLADGLDGMPQKKPAPVGRNTALTDAVALDCEMVGCGEDGKRSVLARVSVVNEDGNVVLDTFVAPGERVVDYRTRVSGVRPADLRDAPPFKEIQRKMADILRGRTLIGHALKNDLKCLLLDHPKSMTRDTALYRPLTRPLRADERARISGAARGRGSRSLRELCKEHLGLEIQAGEHSSVDDARAALLLYRKCAVAWERELRTAGVHTQAERRNNTHKASAKRSAERHAVNHTDARGRTARGEPSSAADDDERAPGRRADPFGVGGKRVDLFRR